MPFWDFNLLFTLCLGRWESLLKQNVSLVFKVPHFFLADFNCTAKLCLEVLLTDLFSISSINHSHVISPCINSTWASFVTLQSLFSLSLTDCCVGGFLLFRDWHWNAWFKKFDKFILLFEEVWLYVWYGIKRIF